MPACLNDHQFVMALIDQKIDLYLSKKAVGRFDFAAADIRLINHATARLIKQVILILHWLEDLLSLILSCDLSFLNYIVIFQGAQKPNFAILAHDEYEHDDGLIYPCMNTASGFDAANQTVWFVDDKSMASLCDVQLSFYTCML